MINDEFSPARLGDYYSYCDICGRKCWASETTKLEIYTGRGGAIVCPECRDPIDYGIIPFTVPAEMPVSFVRDAVRTGTVPTSGGYWSFIAELEDWTQPPTIVNSIQIQLLSATIDQINFITIEQWVYAINNPLVH